MARNLTDKGVAALKPKKSIYHQRDPLMPGHFIRLRPTGSKQFVAMTRNPNGKQVWNTLGTFPLMTIEDARAKAKDIINRLKGGQRVEGPEAFETVANEWLNRHDDRHAYKEEKREALRMLAGLVESILRNDADKKVRRLRG
jgi:hypothetical protein